MLTSLLAHLTKPSEYPAGQTHSHRRDYHAGRRHHVHGGQPKSSSSSPAVHTYVASTSSRPPTSTSPAPQAPPDTVARSIQRTGRHSSPRRSRPRTRSQSHNPEWRRVEEVASSRHRHRRPSATLPPTTAQSHLSTPYTYTRSVEIPHSGNGWERGSRTRRMDESWSHSPSLSGERGKDVTYHSRDDLHHYGRETRGRRHERDSATTSRTREELPIPRSHAKGRSASATQSRQVIYSNGQLYPYATSDHHPLDRSRRSSSSSSANRVAFNPRLSSEEGAMRHSPPRTPPYFTSPVREVNRPVLAERHDPRTGDAYYHYIGSLPTYLPTHRATSDNSTSNHHNEWQGNRHKRQRSDNTSGEDVRNGARPPGFYNRRGDKFIRRGVARRQWDPAMEWHRVFDGCPDPGQGWMDEHGNWLPEQGGILKH